jgi:hypothetical protein
MLPKVSIGYAVPMLSQLIVVLFGRNKHSGVHKGSNQLHDLKTNKIFQRSQHVSVLRRDVDGDMILFHMVRCHITRCFSLCLGVFAVVTIRSWPMIDVSEVLMEVNSSL